MQDWDCQTGLIAPHMLRLHRGCDSADLVSSKVVQGSGVTQAAKHTEKSDHGSDVRSVVIT